MHHKYKYLRVINLRLSGVLKTGVHTASLHCLKDGSTGSEWNIYDVWMEYVWTYQPCLRLF